MIPAVIVPVVRRAILDLLFDIGGEHSDQELTLLLNDLMHRVARKDVAAELEWLVSLNLVAIEPLGPYLAARILEDGREIVQGRLTVEGVSRFKTGD